MKINLKKDKSNSTKGDNEIKDRYYLFSTPELAEQQAITNINTILSEHGEAKDKPVIE